MPQKKSQLALATLLAAALSPNALCAQNSQANSGEFNVPYGSMGIDWLSDEILAAENIATKNTGITPFFQYYGMIASNPYGGQSQGTNYTQEMIFGASANLETLLGWKNTSFTISGAYNSGKDLSNRIGNVFTISDCAVSDGAYFYEMYLSYSREFSFGTIDITLGRSAMADVFNSLPAFTSVLSGGLDNVPMSAFLNSPFTSSPIAAWAATAQYTLPDNEITFAGGIYQIPANMNASNYHGVDWSINSTNGFMMIGQVEWTPEFFKKQKDGKDVPGSGLQGQYQIGVYYFNGYNGLSYYSGSDRTNGYGFYIQGQQEVWVNENNTSQNVLVWAGLQYSPIMSISTMPLMGYAGVQFNGFVPYRPNDSFLVSWLIGSLNSNYSQNYKASYESVVEISYIFEINNYVSIQPDIQYVMRPSGDSQAGDALVLGGQISVSF